MTDTPPTTQTHKTLSWVFAYGLPVVLSAVIGFILYDHPKLFLNDILLTTTAALIVGMCCARLVTNAKLRSGIAILLCAGTVLSAWVGGVGVTHDVDHFFTQPSVYALLLAGWTIGWLCSAARMSVSTHEVVVAKPALGKPASHWPVAIVIAIALAFSLTNLGSLNFQNDEFLNIEAAEGLLQTGKPVLWNFATEQPKISPETDKEIIYDRAFLYTVQVAASVKLFGWSELAARLPSVGWYVVLAVIMYMGTAALTRRRDLAVITAVALLGMDHVMFYGRLIRMYSMTMVLTLVAVGLFYALFHEWTKEQPSYRRLTYIAIPFIAVTLLASHIHLVTLMLLPAYVFFVCTEVGLGMRRGQRLYTPAAVKRLRYSVIAGGTGLVVAGIGLLLAKRAITEYFVGLRQGANLPYLFYPFQDWSIPVVATACFIAAVFSTRHNRLMRYISTLIVLVVYVFVYAVTRYPAPRYISFILPLVVFVTTAWTYSAVHAVASEWVKERAARIGALIGCVLLLVPIALPITSSAFAILQTPRYEHTHENLYGHNILAAYTFVRSRIASDEALLTIDFRSYYWRDSAQMVVELPKEEKMKLTEFEEMLAAHPRAWVVMPKGKMHHLKPAVQEYLHTHGEEFTQEGTNIFIFHMPPL